MEQSWIRAELRAQQNAPELVGPFGFDLLDDDLNLVVNGKNRNTFNKEDLWFSHRTSWHREGLGVWDFLLKSSRDRVPDIGDEVELWREIGNTRVELRYLVLEAHLQTQANIGGNPREVVLSSVSGRSVLELLRVTISVREQESAE